MRTSHEHVPWRLRSNRAVGPYFGIAATRHGDDFGTHIRQQLDAARCIVVLWSRTSIASRVVRHEATAGLDGRLVPVLIESVEPPIEFRQIDAVDLSRWDREPPDDELNRLVDSISAVVSSSSSTPSVLVSDSPAARPFEIDVFISYTHLDNIELTEGGTGWVADLGRALEIRLARLLGRKPVVWVDPQLQGNDTFAETLIDRLGRAAVFVPVVSPGYVHSDWARHELVAFSEAVNRRGDGRVNDKARIVKVLKTPVPVEQQSRELQSLAGHELFSVDPDTKKVREVDQGTEGGAERDFSSQLDDLAHAIARRLADLNLSDRVALQDAAKRERAESASQVLLGVAARREAKRGSTFVARFVAYVEELDQLVKQQLLEFEAGIDQRTVQTVMGLTPDRGGRWAIGTPVTVRVSGTHVQVEPPLQSFEWNGHESLFELSRHSRTGSSHRYDSTLFRSLYRRRLNCFRPNKCQPRRRE